MGLDGPWHWIVLAIVVVVLFGYKKLPDAARSVGRSLRVFKTEIKGLNEDDRAREAATDAAAPKQLETPAPLPQAVVQPAVQPEPQPVTPSTAQPPVNVNGAPSTAPASGLSQPASE